jgi:hypothetical protein
MSLSSFSVYSSSKSSTSAAVPVKNLIEQFDKKTIITCVLGISALNFLSSKITKMVHTSLLLLDVDYEDLDVKEKLPGILIEYGEYSPDMARDEEKYTKEGFVKYHYGMKGGLRYYVKDYFEFIKSNFCNNGHVILMIDANNQMTFSSFINLCAPEIDGKWIKSKYSPINHNCQNFSAHAIDILKPIYSNIQIQLGTNTIGSIQRKESIIPDCILKVLNKYKKKK